MARLLTFTAEDAAAQAPTAGDAGSNLSRTTPAYVGSKAFKVNGVGYSWYTRVADGSSGGTTKVASDATYYHRFYVYIDAAPASQLEVVTIANYGTAANKSCDVSVELGTDRKLYLYFGSTNAGTKGAQIGSASQALATGTWYELQIAVNVPSSGAGWVETRLCQAGSAPAAWVAQTSQTWNLSVRSYGSTLLFGNPNGTSVSIVSSWDDVFLNDSTTGSNNTWVNPALGTAITAAVAVFARNNATQAVAVPIAAATQVQKVSGGRFYANDCASNTYLDGTKRITEQGTATAPSITSGAAVLVDTGSTSFQGYTLNGPGASNNGQANITVDDNFAVCADVGAFSANCLAAASILLYQDANNWYRLEVAKTAGGTSTLYKKSGGGAEVAIATVTKGVALNSLARAKVYRNNSSEIGIVVDGATAAGTDSTPLSGPFTVYLGAPASSGSSSNRVDNIEVTYGTKVRVLGVPTGGGAVAYDAGGSVIASASESSGVVTLDLWDQQFPFTGYVKVCSTLSPITALADGRFPFQGTQTFYGGDDLYYQPSGLTALTAGAEATYATTQTGSHNGVVINGTVTYGVTLGFNGAVLAFRYDEATGSYSEAVIGTQADMHSTCDLQADSSGYLHFVWGGSTFSEQTTKYRKSNTPWSITDLATQTDLGEKIRGSLLVDSSDNLYLVGSRSNSASYDQMVSKKRTAAGTWQSTVVIANADASWSIYPCDATLGRDGKIHAMWMAWSSGTGFEHAFHAKSADGSTWTGITGTSLSLPLSQNSTTGKLSNSATLAADGDYGVSRLTVDSDGTVHAVIGRNSSTYAYFKGDPTTGWPGSPTFAFTGTVYSNHGAIERFGNYLVYLTCWPGYNALTRWISSDGGTTWVETTMLSRPTGLRDAWWWPKLTPVPGQTYTKALWQARGTVYGNKDGSSPLSGGGQGGLYLTNISVVLSQTAPVAVPVFGRMTATQAVAVAVRTSSTKTQAVAVPVVTRRTATQALAVPVTATATAHTVTQAVAVRVQGTVSATLPVAVVVSEPGVFSMNMQMIPGTVVGAYRRHEWIGSEVPVRRAGSYPGPVIEESTVDANGTVAFSTLPPGSYIAWAADYPLRRRFFVVTE